MQEDVEVSFCDLCGTSVPVADLAAGSATKHQGKTIGACCLAVLRGAAPAGGAPATVVAARPVGGNGDSRILPVAIVMLAAVAAATIFLDQRVTSADTRNQQALDQLADQQKGDSQVLASLRVDLDAVPRRQEVAELAAKFDEQTAAAEKARSEQQQRLDGLAGDVAALAREQTNQASRTIDYRPLIEDLRQRQQRLLDLVTTLRAVAPAEASSPVAPNPGNAGNPVAPAEPAAPSLPPALAEHVKKLQAADPAVRFEAVDELLRSKDQLVLPHLLPLARDPDSFVRRLTVEGLAVWKKPEVVEALLVALADGDQYVRDTAWRSLKEVTGQKIPFESDGSKDARARSVQKWQDWWEKNKGSFGA